jgi:hypothetical protein
MDRANRRNKTWTRQLLQRWRTFHLAAVARRGVAIHPVRLSRFRR